jgi:hypothetical protein
MSIFKPVYIDQRVTLAPTEYEKATADIDAFLVSKIRKELEDQCCSHGWVRPGSTQILARSMGQAEHGRFTGDFLFQCKVKVSCLLPYADQILTCRVGTMNKLGAYALVVDDGKQSDAIRILVPRDLHVGNAEFDDLQVGQGIRVRVLRSRFQKGDAFISAVGMYDGRAPQVDVAEGASAVAPQLVVEEGEEVPLSMAAAAGGGGPIPEAAAAAAVPA